MCPAERGHLSAEETAWNIKPPREDVMKPEAVPGYHEFDLGRCEVTLLLYIQPRVYSAAERLRAAAAPNEAGLPSKRATH